MTACVPDAGRYQHVADQEADEELDKVMGTLERKDAVAARMDDIRVPLFCTPAPHKTWELRNILFRTGTGRPSYPLFRALQTLTRRGIQLRRACRRPQCTCSIISIYK